MENTWNSFKRWFSQPFGSQLNQYQSIIEYLTPLLICFSVSLSLIFAVSILHKGFEITDEAYYILSSIHPQAIAGYNSAQHWFTSVLWSLTGSIKAFRLIGLLSLLSSSIFLALSTHCLFTRIFPKTNLSSTVKLMTVCASCAGALLYGTTINFSPSYNLLIAIFSNTSVSFIFLSCTSNKIGYRLGLLLLSGFALAIIFLCKLPAGIATFGLLSAWLLLSKLTKNRIFTDIVILALSSIFWIFIFLLWQSTIADVQQSFILGMKLFQLVQTRSIPVALWQYISKYILEIVRVCLIFSIPIVSFVIYARKGWRGAYITALLSILFILVVGRYFIGGTEHHLYQIQSATFLTILSFSGLRHLQSNLKECLALFAVLFLAPYCAAFGTGNSIFTQVIDYMAPWGVAISLLTLVPTNNHEHRQLSYFLCASFTCLLSLQFITSTYQKPYHMLTPLNHQNLTSIVPSVGAIKTDYETQLFIEDIKRAAMKCKILPGRPFLGLYNVPGVALILEATPPISPWITNFAQAEIIFNLLSSQQKSQLVLAINKEGENPYPKLPKGIEGIMKDFKFCGTAQYPDRNKFIEIWSRE
jgi:hypothetical protein